VAGVLGYGLTRGRPFQPNRGRAVGLSRLVSLARTVVSRSRIQERVVMGSLRSEKAGPRREKRTASPAPTERQAGMALTAVSLAAGGVVPVFNADSAAKPRHALLGFFEQWDGESVRRPVRLTEPGAHTGACSRTAVSGCTNTVSNLGGAVAGVSTGWIVDQCGEQTGWTLNFLSFGRV